MRSLWTILASFSFWSVIPQGFHPTMSQSSSSSSSSSLVCLATKVIADENDDVDEEDGDDLFRNEPCPVRCLTLERSSAPKQAKKHKGSRIFYLILIHNLRTANDAIFLFRAIRDPRNTIVIHFDRKVEHLLLPKQQQQEIEKSSVRLLRETEECPCGSTVRIESLHSVEWSRWSMNLPTLWALQLAASTEYANQWDVFINLSGDTIPVYTVDSMAAILRELPYNFVTSRSCATDLWPTRVYRFPKFWHKRRHYTVDETEADPVFAHTAAATTGELRNKTVTTHFGSQWVILQRSFVHWLVEQLQDDHSWTSQFRDYLKSSDKLMTDETFIPTVLMHANDTDGNDFSMTLPAVSDDGELLWRNGTASGIRHVRFERMDEHYPTALGDFPETQRYQVPDSLIESNTLEQPKVWGPYFLGVYDLGLIRDTGALFARKVSALIDPNLVRLLPVDRIDQIPKIYWPREVTLTEKPDWEEEKQLWRDVVERKRRIGIVNADGDDEEL